MKNKTLFLSVLFISASIFISNKAKAQNYKVDTKNSTIVWEGKKVTGEHNGNISIKEGTMLVGLGSIMNADFTIDMESLNCKDISDPGMNAKLVGHLKSEDFFNTEKFPLATLNITNGTHSDMNDHLLSGTITIKGITQPISFVAELVAENKSVRAKAKITIDRTKFDIQYGSGSFFSKLGDKMIYDEFVLTINLIANPVAE